MIIIYHSLAIKEESHKTDGEKNMYVCFGGHIWLFSGLILALCLGITTGRIWGPIYGVWGNLTGIGCRQVKFLVLYSNSPVLLGKIYFLFFWILWYLWLLENAVVIKLIWNFKLKMSCWSWISIIKRVFWNHGFLDCVN